MSKKRKYHSAQAKVTILRRHFVEKVSVSDLEEHIMLKKSLGER